MNEAAAKLSSSAREQRRHDRYPVSLQVTITAGKKSSRNEATDVSFGGIFVRTDSPPALRNLVRIDLELPSDQKPIQLLGMAVYVARPGNPGGRPAGAGVQFFGIDQVTRDRWERYVGRLRVARGGSAAGTTAVRLHIPERAPKPELRLNAPSVQALHTAIFGGPDGVIAIPSSLDLAPDSTIQLILVHPSSQRQHVLPAVVVGADGKRLRVRIVDREGRADEILRFLDDDFHITVDLEVAEDVDLDDLA